jgi:PAS domain S-box-containing protein
MTEAQPTYDELLARVALLERQLQRGTASGGGESLRAEEALIESRTTLNAIIDSTRDLIWAVDADNFGLLTFNHGLQDYFLRDLGLAIQVGHRPGDLFLDAKLVDRWCAYYRSVLRDGPHSTEYAVSSGTRTLNLSFNLMQREGCAFGISVFGRDITEQKAAEEALRKSEEKFREITERSPVAIYIIQSGKFVYVNPNLAKETGYSREEILGKLAPQDLIHRDDVARLMATLGERAMGKIQGEGVEYRGVRKDGSLVHIEAHGMLIEYQGRPAVMGTLLDITERKRAENGLRESEEQRRAILQTAMDGYLLCDLSGRLLEVNGSYCRMSGYSEQELLGMSLSNLEVAETPSDTIERIQRVVVQGEHRFQSRHRRKDGTVFDVEVSAQHIPVEGGRLMMFLRDISASTRLAPNVK